MDVRLRKVKTTFTLDEAKIKHPSQRGLKQGHCLVIRSLTKMVESKVTRQGVSSGDWKGITAKLSSTSSSLHAFQSICQAVSDRSSVNRLDWCGGCDGRHRIVEKFKGKSKLKAERIPQNTR